MTATIALIRRHPIKSIGGQDLRETTLRSARPLQGDRAWALLHAGATRHVGEVADRWLPKSCFLQGARSAPLQAISGGWDDGRHDGPISLSHPDRPDLIFDPDTEGDRLIDWIGPLWPDDYPPPVRLVRAPVAWADVSQPWVSILSVGSLGALEEGVGQPLGTTRWRGNLWVDGWEPGYERSLIGQILHIGGVELHVTEAIGRCAATSANTETGRIDMDMPAALTRLQGHGDFGVYAHVLSGGTIATGDRISL